jgi:hypothetical protein
MSLRRRDVVDLDDEDYTSEEDDELLEDEDSEDEPEGINVIKMPMYGFTDLDIVGFIRNFINNIAILVNIPIQLAGIIVKLVFWFISIIYPTLFYLIVVWFFWYLLHIYWPYVMQVILVIGIPIANVLIILFNLFFMVAVIIASIVITIWNAFVPFLGMILYVLINVISTILADVYNAIGSIDWEPIVAGFMQIINILVEIGVQILVVLIKVGSEILMALAQIIGPLMQILLTFVKIIMPIVTWILKLLFFILQPILEILGAFFGSGAPSGSRMKAEGETNTARRLFSISLSSTVLNGSLVSDEPMNGEKALIIPEGLTLDEKEEFERFLKGIGELPRSPDDFLETDNDFFTDTIRETLDLVAKPTAQKKEFNAGRKLFATNWRPLPKNNNLKFVDEIEEDLRSENEADGLPDSKLDDAAHMMARQMYTGAKGLSARDMNLAMDTMNVIMEEHRRQGDLAIQSTMREYARKNRRFAPAIGETLASVEYESVVEHPAKMYARFHQEANQRKQQQFYSQGSSGRKLLENWHDVSEEKLAGLRIEHAKAILEQQKKYKNYQDTHHKLVTVVYASVTKTLKNTFEEGVTPTNIMKHWDSMLKTFGYRSIQEVRSHFENTHGDAVNFISAFSAISELPVFRYFKRADATRLDSPYFHDWAIEQRKMNQEKSMLHGRRLHQMQYNQDRDVRGDGESKGALSGFATLSSLDCFSSPKNPLCIPNIPPGFQIRIPLIKLTKKQIEALNQDISMCEPWRLTYCLICVDRFYNTWQSFRWLISTIPFINYPIATLTLQAPWTGVFLDWIFLVPKYRTTSFRQAICFANHLYDVFVSFIVFWLLLRVVPPFISIVRTTYQAIRNSNQTNKQRPWTDIRRQQLIEQWAIRYRAIASGRQEQIGTRLSSRSVRTRSEALRDEVTNVERRMGANKAERHILLARQRYLMEEYSKRMHIDSRFDREHTKHIKKEIQRQQKQLRKRTGTELVIRSDEDFSD